MVLAGILLIHELMSVNSTGEDILCIPSTNCSSSLSEYSLIEGSLPCITFSEFLLEPSLVGDLGVYSSSSSPSIIVS